jgi:hypothetical protein
MSVMQRKLFANKEARTKLRDMGGIMSSFPELSGEVQRFRDGMTVEAAPTGPTLMDQLQSGSLLRETPRLNLDQATRRLLDAGMAPEELQQYVDQRIDLNYLLAQLPPETPPMRSPAEEEVKRINRSRIAGTTTGTPIYEQAVELLPPTPAEDEAAPAEEEPGMTTGTPIYEQRIADLLPTSTETPDETGGGETDTPDIRARAEERIKLFQDLFGSDEPTARDRAMQFAMIGLAIASGQSPNALTNIASGLLAGTQAMTAQEAERRKERRALRSSAVTSVLDEIEAERKAAAEAAKRSGQDYQPTESYADAVLDMTDTLIKEGLADPLEAKRLAQQLIDPLYGRGTPVDTGTVERGRQLVQQLRDSGRPDTEIARLVREAGLDPADLGVTDGQ